MGFLLTVPAPCWDDKLLFTVFTLSLRASAHTGVAIPQLEGKCIDNCPTEWGNVTIFGGNRYLVPFNRGIATPVCGLVRNDRKLETYCINNNLSSGNSGGRKLALDDFWKKGYDLKNVIQWYIFFSQPVGRVQCRNIQGGIRSWMTLKIRI